MPDKLFACSNSGINVAFACLERIKPEKLLKAGKPSSLGTESQPAKVYFTLLTTHYVHLQRVTTRARLTISIKARRNRNGPNLNRHTLI